MCVEFCNFFQEVITADSSAGSFSQLGTYNSELRTCVVISVPSRSLRGCHGVSQSKLTFYEIGTTLREGPDALGDHALCCGTGGERISRHNNLRDALFDTAMAAGLGPVKEGKMTAAAEDCQQQGIAFLPLAAESLGGWH